MRQKGFTPILILLIIVALGTVGFISYKFGVNKISGPVAILPTTTNIPAPTISPTSDPTANWKTYTNTQFGYSLKYPLTLTTQVNAPGAIAGEAQSDSYEVFIYEKDDAEPYLNRYLDIAAYGAMPSVTKDEWMSEEVVVNGIAATKFSKIKQDVNFDIYLFKSPGDKYIQILLSRNKEKSEIANQILFTLKFINSNKVDLNISNWKTFSDTVGKFEFKYPASYILDNSHITPFLNRNITWRFNSQSLTECRGDCPISEKVTQQTISGIQATKIEGYIGEIGGNIPQKYVDYELKLNSGKYFVISLQAAPLYPSAEESKSYYDQQKIIDLKDTDKKVFDQIVSTLTLK